MAEKLVKRHVDLYYIAGANFKNHRKRVGMSQQQLARRLSELTGVEVDRRRISEFEGGFEFAVNAVELAAIKKIFKIS